MTYDPWDALLAAAQEGAPWAWEQIYRALAPRVKGYAAAQGMADPDDLVGAVFLDVARNVGSFRGDEAAFRSWVFTIAHRRIVDERRRRSRRPEVPTSEVPEPRGVAPSAEAAALESLGLTELLAIMERLTEDQRQVLTLRVLADLSVDDVARILGKRPGAVKALQRRAVAALRKELTRRAVSR